MGITVRTCFSNRFFEILQSIQHSHWKSTGEHSENFEHIYFLYQLNFAADNKGGVSRLQNGREMEPI